MKRLFIFLTLTSLLLAACGGTPTPDLEATVQAAVAATQAAPDLEATVQAAVEATQAASDLEATVQAAIAATQAAQPTEMTAPEPTNTPVPPPDTPMPEPPTHTPVSEPVGDTPTPPPPITGDAGPVVCAYYVAPDGNDSAPGAEAQPWATFQHAADTAQPGDTVCFRGGTYPTEETHLTRSGTADAALTFIAYPGETPILDGGGGAGELLILDQGTSYLRISGFTLRNFWSWGIDLTGENRHVQLDHLDIGGGEAGVHFTVGDSGQPAQYGPVENMTLADSRIHDCQYTAVDCTPGPCNEMAFRNLEIYGAGLGEASFAADGLAVEKGMDILVEDCYIHDNGGDGIDLNSRDRAGNVPGIIVHRNRVMRNHQNGIKLWAGGRMENNVVWGQGNSAVWVGVFPSTMEVVNNTIAYNMWDPAYSERNWAFVAGYPEEMESPPVALTLVNNIFAFNADPLGGPTGIYLGPGVNLVREGHNLYYSRADGEITAEFVSGREDSDFTRADIADGTWASYTSQGQGNITSEPLFGSGWPEVNLRLQAGSSAVNAGSTEGVPADDIEGRLRDAVPDIGAYER